MQLREQYGNESLSPYAAASELCEHPMKMKPTNSKQTAKAVIKFHATIFLKWKRNSHEITNIIIDVICFFFCIYLGVGITLAMIKPPIIIENATTTG